MIELFSVRSGTDGNTPSAALPAVVLSHGMGDDTTIWDGVVERLAALGRRTLAYDLPGHGKSPELVDASGYSARASYTSLTQMVAEVGAPVVLAGHSLGGYISCRFAIDHPEEVAALVLVATGPGFRDDNARAKWNEDVQATAERLGRPAALLGLHDDAHVINNLDRITCPTLLLVGERDRAFLGSTDYMERKVATNERHTIADAGHGVLRSHGAEVGDLIAAFLRRFEV